MPMSQEMVMLNELAVILVGREAVVGPESNDSELWKVGVMKGDDNKGGGARLL